MSISYAGRDRATVNFLKTIYFDTPEWTPCSVSLLPATWIKYREQLEEIVLAHPRLFPDFRAGSKDYDDIPDPLYELGRRTDCWGTVWDNVDRGLSSYPEGYPLEDWSALGAYEPPDPLVDDVFGSRDWESERERMDRARRRGGLASGGGLQHGFMYMRLFYLRGFENLMIDLATEEPRLPRLISIVEHYNSVVIQKYVELGAEYMSFGDDLGLQDALPMSPAMWRRTIKPSYERMLRPCREADIPVSLHTDGHVLEIIPDLVEAGVRLLNPQIRANGLEGLRRVARGRVALNQDLDRQLFPFATPSQIEDHIGQVHDALYLAEGGLMLIAECAPDVPLDNIDAICRALEKYCQPPNPRGEE